MVEYTFECDDNFQKIYSNLDYSINIKVKKQILKIINNPLRGKHMRNVRKGTREARVEPYRLSYHYNNKNNHIIFLDFYHKDKQ